MTFDQDALDAASREVHMMLLREGSSWGTKACEEMGRVFMVAYHKALPSPGEAPQLSEALDTVFCNLDANGDPVGAQPETPWEVGYSAGLRHVYRVLKQRGFRLPVTPSPTDIPQP